MGQGAGGGGGARDQGLGIGDWSRRGVLQYAPTFEGVPAARWVASDALRELRGREAR